MMRPGGVLVLVMLAAGTAAQGPALTGIVTDEAGHPLAGAVAYLYDAGRVVLTDAGGRFELPWPSEEDVLTLSAPGLVRASFAVGPASSERTYALTVRDPPTRTVPFPGASFQFGPEARLFGVDVKTEKRSLLFDVEPGANGGSFDLWWLPNETRLQATIVNVASQDAFGFLHGDPPLHRPLGSALLRDQPGSFSLDIDLRDGTAVDVTARLEGAVTYGPWVAKTVQGKRPEVLDGIRDSKGARLGDLDITSIRFTNETEEQVDVEMDLTRLDSVEAPAGLRAFWSVHWMFADRHWAVFLRGAESGAGPEWLAAQCGEDGLLNQPGLGPEPTTTCSIMFKLYGTYELGAPGRIRWHVPKVTIGQPPDGEGLERPMGNNFLTPADRTPLQRIPLDVNHTLASDETLPGRPYTFGAEEYAVAPDAAARLPSPATIGSVDGSGLSFLGLVATAVVAAGGAVAWGARRRRARAGAGGRYRSLRLLGHGSSGRTWLARDRLSGDMVAVKECLPGHDAASRARLVKEADIARRIAHPNVVRVLDIEERPHADAIVMEYVAGGSLEARLERGPLAAGEGLAVWRDVLAGLAAIHAASIVHRDVKPSNVLLTLEGRAKVADFGIARSAEETFAGPEASPVGTPLYMAPEQLRGREPTTASDVYASAAVAYRMLTGRSHVHVSGRTAWDVMLARRGKRPDLPIAGLPPWLNDLLARCLAEGPARRPSAAEALRELQRHAPRG